MSTTKPKKQTKKKMTPKSQNQDAPQDDDSSSNLLKGVVAFVDVQKKLGKTVTHVFFKEGKPSTWKNSNEKDLKLVSPQWIEECLKKNEVLDLDDFKAEEPQAKPIVKAKKTETPKKRKTDEKEESPKKKKKLEKETSEEEAEEEKKEKKKTVAKKEEKSKKETEKKDEGEEKVEKKKVIKKVVKKVEPKKDEKEKKKDEKKKEEKKKPATPKKTAESSDKKKKPTTTKKTEKKKKGEKEIDPEDKMEEEFVGDEEEEEEEEVDGKTFDETDEEEDEEELLEEEDELESSPQRVNSDLKKFEKKLAKAEYIFELSGVEDFARETVMDVIESKSDSSLSVYPTENYEGQRFTHLISDSDKRTLKVLFAIAFGAKIIKSEWLLEKVIEKGDWVDEIDYIRKKFLKQIEASIESNKKPETDDAERVTFPLFYQRKFCLVGEIKPKKLILERLINACGGKVVASVRRCDICIAGEGAPKLCLSEDDSFSTVNVNWLFDCVGNYEIQDTKKYEITKQQIDEWEKLRKSPKNSAKKLSKKKEEKMIIEEQDNEEEEEIEKELDIQVEVDQEVDEAMKENEIFNEE
eukprot:gene11096-3803_t